MNVRLLLLSAIVLLLSTGCRKDPHMQVYIDNMNSEKRMLEDTLYDLQYDYDSKVAEVEKLRAQIEGEGSDSSSVLVPGSDSSDVGSGVAKPRDRFPDSYDMDLPDLDIDQGTPADPDSGGGESPKEDEESDAGPPPLDLGEGEPLAIVPMPINQKVTSLYLNTAHTGGLQQDEEPGDDGVVVVFQPRNDSNEFVPLAGRVSVALLDPESKQRVAMWEISEEQAELALQKARAGRGIELEMPWRDSSPTKSRLHLFVRYWLADGQAVQADREITITPSGRLASRWTPRTEKRPDPPRRLDVADNHEATPVDPGSGLRNPRANDHWKSNATPADNRRPARQAGLPLWRPYR